MKIKEAYKDTVCLLNKIYNKSEAASIAKLVFGELGFPYTEIIISPEKAMDTVVYRKLDILRKKLTKGIPVQYALGYTWFLDKKLKVNSSCLIPRPETEELVELIAKQKKNYCNIIDIGTGSGCIAISLKEMFPGSQVTGIDKFPETLQLAKENAKLNFKDIRFIQSDIFYPEREISEEKYDLIVSNPPYVRESEKTQMHRNVLENEPEEALFVTDRDPLVFYRAIAEFSKKCLHNNGDIFLELNENLGISTSELFRQKLKLDAKIYKDIHGRERFLKISQYES